MKNAYAAKLMAAKAALSARERQAIVHHCLTTIWQAAAVALHEEYGFGPERLGRFRDRLDKTMLEFGTLQDGADADYAIGALERRYRQVMGEQG